jgi:hypothetical protein
MKLVQGHYDTGKALMKTSWNVRKFFAAAGVLATVATSPATALEPAMYAVDFVSTVATGGAMNGQGMVAGVRYKLPPGCTPSTCVGTPEAVVWSGDTVKGLVTIRVSARDDQDPIDKLRVFVAVAGQTLRATNEPSTQLYKADWNSAGVADGAYTIRAFATDSQGNRGQSQRITQSGQRAVDSGSALCCLNSQLEKGEKRVQLPATPGNCPRRRAVRR